jgi:hypothetical protein
MKPYAAFIKLVVDGLEIRELIPREKKGGQYHLPKFIQERLRLKGISITTPSDREVHEYLIGKWRK